jgi:hypothetical protein
MDEDQGMAVNGQSGWPNASMDGCAFIQIERCGHTPCRMPIAFQARQHLDIRFGVKPRPPSRPVRVALSPPFAFRVYPRPSADRLRSAVDYFVTWTHVVSPSQQISCRGNAVEFKDSLKGY